MGHSGVSAPTLIGITGLTESAVTQVLIHRNKRKEKGEELPLKYNIGGETKGKSSAKKDKKSHFALQHVTRSCVTHPSAGCYCATLPCITHLGATRPCVIDRWYWCA